MLGRVLEGIDWIHPTDTVNPVLISLDLNYHRVKLSSQGKR
jgi:hypothetical protein